MSQRPWWHWCLSVLGWANAFPLTLIVTPAILVLAVAKQVRLYRPADDGLLTLAFLIPLEVVPGSKLEKSSWRGMTCGCYALVNDRGRGLEKGWLHRAWRHEQEHVFQQYGFGVLMPVLYVMFSIIVWVFMRDKHSYFDNPFEAAARKAAGQQVVIPRDQWWDEDDRWLWW